MLSKFLPIPTICIITRYLNTIIYGFAGVMVACPDMSREPPPSLLPSLLNNILNFKVIFHPALITRPSPEPGLAKDRCRELHQWLVFIILLGLAPPLCFVQFSLCEAKIST